MTPCQHTSGLNKLNSSFSDSDHDDISPLKPLKDSDGFWFWFVKATGFPLKVTLNPFSTKIKHISYTTTLQFENCSSTKLERKRGFTAMFVIGASFPILLMVIFFTYAYTRNVTFPHLMKLIMYFSPLTAMDIYSMWSYFPANIIVHWTLFKAYTGMEKSLSEFLEAFVQTMTGIVTRGN